ncbi:ImmA/IrrE family metallo-endopeptidase [Paenibacillus lactis]|jgi:Zn-dependent peptidase ImmA (M78 family)|uniref:ImmA/IrrE family metallo-endopeptidase n=1 Tax=Paenibacillus TaxID=44249 RepID=UPI002041C60B|nr:MULTISPECIES: ImmA/IrrE family metallo-endopeptidase [Paenibacillus]MCI1777150.1 ImmA/IrrE family metallo-endopeptidase [Paenibacillus lautus]MCM3494524.1 ImmA/IrrE family metallo-endopeptidase [Paenibacillus lactis]
MAEQKKARELILTHGTNSPLDIANERNIVVLFEDLGKQIWGYYSHTNRIPVIHINNRLSQELAIYTGAHELGHAVLHSGINTPFLRKNTLFSVDKIERQAHRLAVHLLIGHNSPEPYETKKQFLIRCGIPEIFHIYY